MEIRFIERGTQLNIIILAENPGSSVKLNGFLHDTKHHIGLLLEGDKLYEYCMKQRPGLRLSLTFYRGSKIFSFQGKLERTLTMYGVRLTEIAAITGIEEKNRRSVPRFRLTADVKLYVQKEKSAMELICTGQSQDISCDAICLLTNNNIHIPDNSKFYIEFTLYGCDFFSLPAKLLRKGNSPQSSYYKYDYVFAFDFSHIQDERGRLIDSFFINSLKARNS